MGGGGEFDAFFYFVCVLGDFLGDSRGIPQAIARINTAHSYATVRECFIWRR